MQHKALRGKKVIARGVFSAVYEGSRPNTVLKLTADSYGYRMLNDWACCVKHRHFPRVKIDHEQIGDFRMNGEHFPLFLFEMERLEKLATGSDARRLASRISREQNNCTNDNWNWPADDRARFGIMSMIETGNLNKSIKNALGELEQFCGNNPGAVLDMHLGNFMQRKNGELVITDPLCDRLALKTRYACSRPQSAIEFNTFQWTTQ